MNICRGIYECVSCINAGTCLRTLQTFYNVDLARPMTKLNRKGNLILRSLDPQRVSIFIPAIMLNSCIVPLLFSKLDWFGFQAASKTPNSVTLHIKAGALYRKCPHTSRSCTFVTNCFTICRIYWVKWSNFIRAQWCLWDEFQCVAHSICKPSRWEILSQ